MIASWFLFPLDNVQFASYNLPAIFTSFGPIVPACAGMTTAWSERNVANISFGPIV